MPQPYPVGYAMGGQTHSQQPYFIIIPSSSGPKHAYQNRAQVLNADNLVYADRRLAKLKIGSKPKRTHQNPYAMSKVYIKQGVSSEQDLEEKRKLVLNLDRKLVNQVWPQLVSSTIDQEKPLVRARRLLGSKIEPYYERQKVGLVNRLTL